MLLIWLVLRLQSPDQPWSGSNRDRAAIILLLAIASVFLPQQLGSGSSTPRSCNQQSAAEISIKIHAPTPSCDPCTGGGDRRRADAPARPPGGGGGGLLSLSSCSSCTIPLPRARTFSYAPRSRSASAESRQSMVVDWMASTPMDERTAD